VKLVSFVSQGRPSYGVVKGGGVIDLGSRLGDRRATLRALLAAGALAEAQRVARDAAPDIELEGLELAPVIPDPDKIICVGLNYRAHVEETGRTVTEKPTLFARFAGSQVGHLRPLVKPKVSDEFDYEGELAVVIGNGGRHIPAERALEHVAGYSCYNEGSIRDWQRHTSQFLAGKSFAGTGGFGPWLVTADEIPDPSRLTLETRLNGQIVQHTTTDLMITPVAELIAYLHHPAAAARRRDRVRDVRRRGLEAQPAALHAPGRRRRSGDQRNRRAPQPGRRRGRLNRRRWRHAHGEGAIESITKLTALGYIGVRSAGLDDWVRTLLVSPACEGAPRSFDAAESAIQRCRFASPCRGSENGARIQVDVASSAKFAATGVTTESWRWSPPHG